MFMPTDERQLPPPIQREQRRRMRDVGKHDGCGGRLTGGKAMAEAHQLLQLAPDAGPACRLARSASS
jgi:hypothetical protein